ncbi:MAG TPA: PA2779 family protein [Burkholderiales bacterium]
MKPARVAMLMVALALAAPARAGLVATDATRAGDERARVKLLIERPELAGQLQRMGLAPGDATARVDALNDAEVHALAGHLDRLVAGGDFANQTPLILIIVLLVLVILLI